jgi:N-acyl-D-amino-acid deacylase
MDGLLIRGGTVIDGTGGPARRADVRVRDGVIAEVGRDLRPDGEHELDASGATVTPGFIDIHTHLDPSLFWDPLADPMPQHGVTTAIMGNCSLSLAPLLPSFRDSLAGAFCFIEDMPETAFATAIPWSWETYAQYRDALGNGGLSLNAAALIGHTPLRMYVMGEEAWERPATPDERRRIAALLEDSLLAGAFGLSTSFFDEDADHRPVPCRLADDDELDLLMGVLAKHRGFLQFVPNFMSGQPDADIERVAKLAEGRDVTITWSVLTQSDRAPDRPKLLDRAAEMQAAGLRIHPQVSPRTIDQKVNWDYSMAFMSFPRSWDLFIKARGDVKRSLLEDPAWRAAARQEWDGPAMSMFPTTRPHKVRLISVSRPEQRHWLGRTLADLTAERGGHLSDVLADWVLENDLNPGVLSVGVSNDDVDAVAGMLRHPAALVGGSDAGAHVGMMCAAGDTTLLLTRHVRDRGDFTLENAVWQLTGRPAEIFGFRNRGRVTEGAVADLTVFALDELAWLPDVFVEDLPGGESRLRRPPGGYRYTVAGGVVTQTGGQLSGGRPGSVLDARTASPGSGRLPAR